ncbi:MAG: hypothetical protein J1F64_10150 [Oscillospiraceae bacterium]|nr:hypothetical protein [Oscillospiraceae bacterium]
MSTYKNYDLDKCDLSENISDNLMIESDKSSGEENEVTVTGFTPYTEEKKKKTPVSDKAAAWIDPNDVEECDVSSKSYNRKQIKKLFKKWKNQKKKNKKKTHKKSKKQSKTQTKKAKSDNSGKKDSKYAKLVAENTVLRTKLKYEQYSKRSLIQGIFIGAHLTAKDDAETEKIAKMKRLLNGDDRMIVTNETYMLDTGGDRNDI